MTSTGSQFGGMMDAQSRSVNGLMSAMSDKAGQTARLIAEQLMQAFDLRGILQSSIAGLTVFQKYLADHRETLQSVAGMIKQVGMAFGVMTAGAMAYAAAQRVATVSAIMFQAALNPASLVKIGVSLGSRTAVAMAQRSLDPKDPIQNPNGRKYSLMRAINQRVKGQPIDGYEGELSAEIARRSSSSPNGFYVPLSLPMGFERRAVDSTTGAGLVESNVLAGRLIDALRHQTVLAGLGATLLNDLTGNVEVPKQTGVSSAYWVSEGTAVTGSTPTIGQVSLKPSTVGAYTDITRRLAVQSSYEVERLVRNDLIQVLGIELDRVGINGSGVGVEPLGILQNEDIPTVAIGTNGGAPSWAKVVELESTVKTASADRGAMAYLTSNFGRGKLKTTTKGTRAIRRSSGK